MPLLPIDLRQGKDLGYRSIALHDSGRANLLVIRRFSRLGRSLALPESRKPVQGVVGGVEIAARNPLY
jgi:hypothetical protein